MCIGPPGIARYARWPVQPCTQTHTAHTHTFWPAAGSFAAKNVALITLNHFAKGIAKLASILIAMAVGYLIALPLGMVNFSPVGEAGWLHVPMPFHFGVEFVPSAIVSMVIMFVVK